VDLFKRAIKLGKQAEIVTVMKIVSGQSTPLELADQVASLLEVSTAEKQKFLEDPSLLSRLKRVFESLIKEVNVLEVEKALTPRRRRNLKIN